MIQSGFVFIDGADSLSIVSQLVSKFVQHLLIVILIFRPCIYIFPKEWLLKVVYAKILLGRSIDHTGILHIYRGVDFFAKGNRLT